MKIIRCFFLHREDVNYENDFTLETVQLKVVFKPCFVFFLPVFVYNDILNETCLTTIFVWKWYIDLERHYSLKEGRWDFKPKEKKRQVVLRKQP